MTRAQALDLLMLLSALESWAMSQHSPLPEYLHDDLAKEVKRLKSQVMEGAEA